jgi:hypothetical protein
MRDSNGNKVATLKVMKSVIKEKGNFLEFVRGGLQLALIGAIDFTSSNGDPNDPYSLHFIKKDGYNSY